MEMQTTLFETMKSSLPIKKLVLKRNASFILTFGYDDVIWGVEDGVILAEKNNNNGTLLGTGIYSRGMLLGVTSLNGDEGIITCRAIKKTTLIRFKTTDVIKLLKKKPELMMDMIKFLAGRFRFMMDYLEINSLHNTDERIEYFENMLSKFGDPELMNISDTVIAEYLGMHPISVSRARKQILEKNKAKRKSINK